MPQLRGAMLVSFGILLAASSPGHTHGIPPALPLPSGEGTRDDGTHPAPDGRKEPASAAPHPTGAITLNTGGAFSPSLFHFVTTVPDKGTGKAGGWQVASARLNFVDTRYLVAQYWACWVEVGMPLRTERDGKISPADAALITADVATAAAPLVMQLQAEWMPVTFCQKYGEEMRRLFRERYKTVGARVERSQ